MLSLQDKERREQRAAQILEDKKRLKAAQEAKKQVSPPPSCTKPPPKTRMRKEESKQPLEIHPHALDLGPSITNVSFLNLLQAALDRKLGNDPSRPRVKATRRPSTSRPSTSASRPGSTGDKGGTSRPGTGGGKGGGDVEEAHNHAISGEAAGVAKASPERLEAHVEAVPSQMESRGEEHTDAVEGETQAGDKGGAEVSGAIEAGGVAAVAHVDEVVVYAVGEGGKVAGAADEDAATGARMDGDVDAISGSDAVVPEQQAKDTDVNADSPVVELPRALDQDEVLSGTVASAGNDEEGGRQTGGGPEVLNLDEDVQQA